MRKSVRLLAHAILGAALLAPVGLSSQTAKADDSYNYGYSNYYPSYNTYGFNGYGNFYQPYYNGYFNYYPNYYGYNPYYGFNGYYPGYYYNNSQPGVYRYSNGYLYYVLNDGSYYVNYNGQWVRGDNNNTNSGNDNSTSSFEALRNDPHYRYENGYHYYIKDNGDYYYYANGKWNLVEVEHPAPEPRPGSGSSVTSETNSNTSSESSAPVSSDAGSTADSTASSEVGSDAGSVADSTASSEVGSDTGSVADSTASSESSSPATSDAGSTADSTASSEVGSDAGSVGDSTASSESSSPVTSDAGSTADSTASSAVGSDAGSVADSTASSESSSSVTSDAGSTADSTASSEVGSDAGSVGDSTASSESSAPVSSDAGSTADSTASSESNSSAPVTSETAPNGNDVSHPDYGPDPRVDYDKLPKPTLPPTDPNMQADPRFVDSDGTYYYVVAQTDEERERGIDGYYKWDGFRWVLHNGTASDDPGLDPSNHTHTEDSDYVYDDKASTFKVYSENIIGNGLSGDALPFKTVDEFKDYVIRHYAPVFKDNAGWDCKVTWELEDADGFNNSKDAAWARDYVLVANLKSGVDKDEYKDTELGYVKFIYRVSPDVRSDYAEIDSAKIAFNQINAERKANGLAELTWSDDLYNATTLPHAKEISRQYDSDGFVDRRETDGKVVANKWLNSGLRDLLLSPDAKEVAVACVVAGDGTYYWTLNYK